MSSSVGDSRNHDIIPASQRINYYNKMRNSKEAEGHEAL